MIGRVLGLVRAVLPAVVSLLLLVAYSALAWMALL
jgi:hypothetical protein